MRNKFWFHAFCWLGWAALLAISVFSKRPGTCLWSVPILIVWIGAVILTGWLEARKDPALAGLTIGQRLKASSWVQGFVVLAFTGGLIWVIFLFPENRRIAAAFITAGIAAALAILGVAIFVPRKNK